jgi:hypothetical protein
VFEAKQTRISRRDNINKLLNLYILRTKLRSKRLSKSRLDVGRTSNSGHLQTFDRIFVRSANSKPRIEHSFGKHGYERISAALVESRGPQREL